MSDGGGLWYGQGVTRRPLLLICCCLWLAPLSALAQSEPPSIEAAQEMLARQEYDRAQRAFDQLLATGNLGPERLVDVYRGLAECAAALRQPEQAREAFIALLAIDEDFYIPTHESPLLREPFEQAVSFWRDHQRPALRYTPPRETSDQERFVVQVDVVRGDRPALLTSVTVHFRLPDGTYEAIDAPEGRAELGEDRLRGAEEVELYVTGHDEWGNRVTQVGSESRPLRVDLSGGEDSGRRWYRQWWFWTIVGAVVVGLSVGLPLGLRDTGGGSSCQEALGGPCDFELHPDL